MRLLVVNWLDRENPRSGGAEIHMHEVFGRLAARGHEVSALVSGWSGAPPRAELDGIDIHRVGGRHSFLVRARGYAHRELAPAQADCLIEDLNKVPLFTPSWEARHRLLLVHHLFGATAFREASPPFAAATWLLERPIPLVYRDTPVVAVSDSTARDLEDRGMDRSRIDVIPNGVDADHYRPGGARSEVPLLLYLGRLKRYKRIDLVLRAVAELRGRGVACRAVVAGRGDHLPALRTLAGRLGIEEQVEFPGFVSEARKVELFQSAWCHVLTSPKEGWGIANLEAAACGTATVASDSPGLRDSVRHGETGFLVPHGEVGALADRLESLLRDPALRDSLGSGARAFAERFSWDRVADRWEAQLAELVGA